jgi:hypothetical protein
VRGEAFAPVGDPTRALGFAQIIQQNLTVCRWGKRRSRATTVDLLQSSSCIKANRSAVSRELAPTGNFFPDPEISRIGWRRHREYGHTCFRYSGLKPRTWRGVRSAPRFQQTPARLLKEQSQLRPNSETLVNRDLGMLVRAAGIEPARGYPQRIFVPATACAASSCAFAPGTSSWSGLYLHLGAFAL